MQSISQFLLPIGLGASDSAALDCGKSAQLVGIATDADWTAQAITLLVSLNGTDYIDLKTLEIAAAPASTYFWLDTDVTKGVRYLKVHSGVAQAKATVITAVVRALE